MAGVATLFASAPEALDLNLIPEEEFTDNKFLNAIKLSFSRTVTNEELRSLGTVFIEQLKSGALTDRTPTIALILACHLLGRDKISTPLLTKMSAESTQPIDIDELMTSIAPSRGPSTSAAAVTRDRPERRPAEAEEAYRIRIIAWEAATAKEARINPPPVGEPVSNTFARFCAAYSLRLIVKSANNMMLGQPRFASNYLKFYAESIPNTFAVTLVTWDKYKTLVTSSSRLINTWVTTIARYESGTNYDDDNSEMIRYLANLPLSFSGMHAYALFIDVMRKTGKEMRWLLQEMWASPTKEALIQIMQIANSFEKKTPADTYSTYYRYARIISPKYFTKIQTKNALSLVYLEAKILHFYEPFTDRGPEQIAALTPLGASQRNFLDRMANVMISKILGEEDDTNS